MGVRYRIRLAPAGHPVGDEVRRVMNDLQVCDPRGAAEVFHLLDLWAKDLKGLNVYATVGLNVEALTRRTAPSRSLWVAALSDHGAQVLTLCAVTDDPHPAAVRRALQFAPASQGIVLNPRWQE